MKLFVLISVYLFTAACAEVKKEADQPKKTEKAVQTKEIQKTTPPPSHKIGLLLKDESVDGFYEWLQKNSKKIPDVNEQEILLTYVKYLSTTKPSDGIRVVSLMKAAAQKSGKPISSEWLSFFEGHPALNYLGESIGSLSLKRLYPLVEMGNQTAIDLVLMYSSVFQADGADSEGLAEYQRQVRKHKKAIAAFAKANAVYLSTHPIMWYDK